MKKSLNVVSLKKKRFEKKYSILIKNNKYLIIFVGIPILITSLIIIDREILKDNFQSRGIKYNPSININRNYIINESKENEFLDIKEYYVYKEKFKDYIEERKEAILKY